ncbi:MAG TPA: hypothetical protein VJV23_08830 [Candidatus Polarisedimenticolia bacterium]|nr:hypothetical protein [Candidatus Polarisedimenticolia bacterium]
MSAIPVRSVLAIVFPVLLIAASPAAPAAPGAAGSAAAFDRLRALEGRWEAKGPDGAPLTVSYKVMAQGSVLVEELSYGGMVTMYHMDGDEIMMTHYCAGKNQPRMRASGLEADGRTLRFRFHDISNLADPDQAHMRRLTITFNDADHVTQEWVHQVGRQEQPMRIELARAR